MIREYITNDLFSVLLKLIWDIACISLKPIKIAPESVIFFVTAAPAAAHP